MKQKLHIEQYHLFIITFSSKCSQFGSDAREQIKEMMEAIQRLDALVELDEDDSEGDESDVSVSQMIKFTLIVVKLNICFEIFDFYCLCFCGKKTRMKTKKRMKKLVIQMVTLMRPTMMTTLTDM